MRLHSRSAEHRRPSRCVAFVAAVATAGALTLVLGSVPAFAAWRTASASGGASGQAHRLPDGPSASVAHAGYGSVVTLSWPGATYDGGAAFGGYVVRAYDVVSGVPRLVGGSCGGTVAGVACTETAAPDGRWRYTLTAAHGQHWLGAEGPSSAPVSVDTTGPAGATLDPLPATVRNGQALTGRATDAVSGVASVTYLSCAGTACVPTTVLGTGTTAPDFAFAWTGQPADGTYRIGARVTDAAGNATDTAAQTVTVDNTAPVTTVTAPAAGAVTNALPSFAGAAGNTPSDSATVMVRVYAGAGTGGPLTQTLTATRTGTTWWSVVPVALADGTYTVQAAQADAAGNVGLSAARTFRVDATPPAVVAITGTNASGKVEQGDTLRLTFGEALDPASVPATSTITITNTGGLTGNDTMDIPGITNGPVSLGSTGLARTNRSYTFNASVALSSGNTVLTVTVGICAVNCSVTNAIGGFGTLVFVPALSLKDVVGNPAAGSLSVPIKIF